MRLRHSVLSLAISALALSSGSAALAAGGISGGGGGVTNPKPAAPAAVTNAVEKYGRLALLAWFQGQELNFTVYPAGEKANQLAAKLFSGPASIYNVLQKTGVEFHDSSPCFDANGEAKDASIYSQTPGNICMSLSLMAPKLNERNVNNETLALLAHEMSHLSGTTEDEAVALQDAMLRDLDFVSLGDFVTAKANAYSLLGRLTQTLKIATNQAASDVSGEAFVDVISMTGELQLTFMFNKKPFVLVRPNELALATTSLARLGVVRAYFGTLASTPDPRLRGFFQNQLEKSFIDKSEATAREILTNGFHNRLSASPVYDQVVIQRPTSGAIAASELDRDFDQVKLMLASLPYINDKSIPATHIR